MRNTVVAVVLAASGFALGAAPAAADVIIRGPFGRMIVVTAPVDVRLGSGTTVSAPAPVAARTGPTTTEPPIVSTSRPVVRPEMEVDILPLPQVLPPAKGSVALSTPTLAVAPIPPRDFAKIIKPVPGRYEVLFQHPVNKQPVNVSFELPPGTPRVSYCLNSLVFDYGRHEVEIRFKLGGKVVVT
jgi:hypothetical protein